MIDPRNKLNDLTNKEWIIETKSVWQSQPPKRDPLKIKHPATFAESDIERLICFFTKNGEKVLDPFVGTGSSLIACSNCGRIGTGIELGSEWVQIAKQRLDSLSESNNHTIIQGDSREVLPKLPDSTFDFIVTSPPYWMILQKDNDHKVKRERKSKGFETRYSDSEADLGNQDSYEAFLDQLEVIFSHCARVLVSRKYMAVIVSDFRHKSKFIPFHSHISTVMEKSGFSLEGITILVQDSKALYPYGMPYSFVSNIHHQYILVFRKTL